MNINYRENINTISKGTTQKKQLETKYATNKRHV
jgi:hypothetical protein